MDIEEIYRVIHTAEETQEFLPDEALRYENYVEDFYSEDGYPVSREMLLDETRHMVNVLESHEELYSRLDRAREEVEDINTFRFHRGKSVEPESLLSRIDELQERYDEYFEAAWSAGLKPHRDPTVPDPIHMKYRMWEKEQMESPDEALEKAMEGLEEILPR
ncbi:MAG: hypothetical protein ABEJ75_02570 [Candidatus Nanohaloarchaea archaeon]